MLRFFNRKEQIRFQLVTESDQKKPEELTTVLDQYKIALQSMPNTVFHTNAIKLLDIRNAPSQLSELDEKIEELTQLTILINKMNELLECIHAQTVKPRPEVNKKYIPDIDRFNTTTRNQQDPIIFSMKYFIRDCISFHDNVSQFVFKTESEEKTNREDITLISNFAAALSAVIKSETLGDGTALRQLLECEEKINNKASLSTNCTLKEIAHKASTISTYVFTVASVVCTFFPLTMSLGMMLMGPAMFFMLITHLIDAQGLSQQRSAVQSTKAISHHARTFLDQLSPKVSQPEAVAASPSPPLKQFLFCRS